jgi:GAF domain-containing protein
VPAVFAAKRAGDHDSRSPGVGAGVHEALAQAADVLSVSGAAVGLVQAGRLTYLPSPVAAVAAVERRAVQRPDGPWATAATSRQPVSTNDTVDDIRAVAAAPMFAGRRMVGVLGLYDALRRVWSDSDLHHVGLLADFVGRHIASEVELRQQRQLVEQLTTALESRVVIEQAKGVLAAQHGIEPDEAFQILRKRSRDRNTKLRQIAAEVVAEVSS